MSDIGVMANHLKQMVSISMSDPHSVLPCPNRKTNKCSQCFIMDVLPQHCQHYWLINVNQMLINVPRWHYSGDELKS